MCQTLFIFLTSGTTIFGVELDQYTITIGTMDVCICVSIIMNKENTVYHICILIIDK